MSNEEIEEILEESRKEKYSDPRMILFGLKKTSIFKLSRETGLILVMGNEHIGYNHIIERHSLTSRKPYWKDGKIGEPSKLPLGVAPIQYLTIAGKIFKPENKNYEKNSNPELFDVYIGDFKYRNQATLQLKLITYKGTGIIQTMYPLTKRKEKVLRNLRRGFISKGTYNDKSGIKTYEMSYFDEQEIERFKVILRSLEFERLDKWYVQVNDEKGIGRLTALVREEALEYRIEVPFRMTILDFLDITWLEKEIKKMINNKYDF